MRVMCDMFAVAIEDLELYITCRWKKAQFVLSPTFKKIQMVRIVYLLQCLVFNYSSPANLGHL